MQSANAIAPRASRGLCVAVFLVLAASGLLCSRSAAQGPPGPPTTVIDEVVMYGVDDDTDVLLRYAFSAEEYRVVGEIRDDDGNIVDEIESLAYIPHGPHKGLYGVTNYDGNVETRLVEISLLDARSTVRSVDIGFGNVEGMIALRDPVTDQWLLYATHTEGGPQQVTLCHIPPGNPGNPQTITVGMAALPAHLAHGDSIGACGEPLPSNRNLIAIDPASGVGTLVMPVGLKFEGLARGPDGTLYAAENRRLWTIDPVAGTVSLIGEHAYLNVEALEYAFGDYDPQIDVPGVPDEWTADGVLFGFSDTSNAMLILNPATGEAVEYDCPIDTTDCEGMVFLTEQSDPVYHVLNIFD